MSDKSDIMDELNDIIENNDYDDFNEYQNTLEKAVKRERKQSQINILEILYTEWIKGPRDNFKKVIRAKIDRLKAELNEKD